MDELTQARERMTRAKAQFTSAAAGRWRAAMSVKPAVNFALAPEDYRAWRALCAELPADYVAFTASVFVMEGWRLELIRPQEFMEWYEHSGIRCGDITFGDLVLFAEFQKHTRRGLHTALLGEIRRWP